jgi:uncharacterized cupredoxin-like copper-binding protein
MKKKHGKIFTVLMILLTATVFAACSGVSYEMTGTADKATIKIKADDGKYAEGIVMNKSRNEVIVIDSQLNEGELQIEFQEVYNRARSDEPDDYEVLSTLTSVNVKPGDHLELPIDYAGDFRPDLTSIGHSEGTVVITVVKP